MQKSSLLGKSSLIYSQPDITERGKQLIALIRQGDYHWLYKTCSQDDLHYQDSKGRTLLYYACLHGKHDIVLYLINKGLPVNQLDSEGRNLWHVCAYSGSLQCLSVLMCHTECLRRMLAGRNLQQALSKYRFKKSDYKTGELVATSTEQRQKEFKVFKEAAKEVSRSYFNSRLEEYSEALSAQDSVELRTALHLGSLNKCQRCFPVLELMLREGCTNYQDYVEMSQRVSGDIDHYEDPRIYNHLVGDLQNALSHRDFQELKTQEASQFRDLVKSVINLKDKGGFTALHLASYEGSSSISMLLKRLGAQISDTEDSDGQKVVEIAKNNSVRKVITNLCEASEEGDNQTISLLINCGQDINAKKTIFGVTPLYNSILYCSKSNSIDPAKTLLQNGADINIQDVNGWTSLHKACEVGNMEMMELLLSKGASTTKASNKGWVPLHIAALHDHYQIIELLKNRIKGLQLEVRDHEGCTPLILASKKGCNKAITQLIELGANLYAEDNKKMTSLHYATFKQHIQTIKLLLYYDADYDKLRGMRNCHGKPAKELSNDSVTRGCFDNVWSTSREGKLDILRRLILEGADKDGQTFYLKRTPLIYGILQGHFLVVKYLLQEGASTYPEDSKDQTAESYLAIYLQSATKGDKSKARQTVQQIKQLFSSHEG